MPRLIDAEKLKNHYSWWDNEEQKTFDTIVDLQPTVNAVEVVRCKDCTHSRTKEYGTHKLYFCAVDHMLVTEEDFCSKGRTKHGAESI